MFFTLDLWFSLLVSWDMLVSRKHESGDEVCIACQLDYYSVGICSIIIVQFRLGLRYYSF